MGKKTLKHLDLFSGYGGFTIPASKYGIETINFSEIDKYATAVLKYRFPDIKNLGDVTKIKPEDLPDVDIITGGSPCQDLSVAGKGAGLNGERSGLFFHFVRLIKEKQPTYFVWENVKGAFSSQRGWDFARVQIEMEQAGYDVWWQLINAKDFGVPQNRERIFAIGIRKGSGREILFEQRESVKNLEFVGGTKHRKKWLGDSKENSRNFSQGDRIYSPEGTSQNLNANGGGLGAKTGLYLIAGLTSHYRGSPDGDGRSAVMEDMRIRRLTPIECERLMGLEDGWTAKGIIEGEEVDISDTQRYKMCGNGVVVNCVDYIYNLIGKTL